MTAERVINNVAHLRSGAMVPMKKRNDHARPMMQLPQTNFSTIQAGMNTIKTALKACPNQYGSG
ncbi:MAG: hypothetical protein IPI91_15785 [Flavobacteriales bacterium]|nr:hypothetical protein [Flavobacteriales bacterium]